MSTPHENLLYLFRHQRPELDPDGRTWQPFTAGVAGYPHRTMEQTRFVVDCARELSPRATTGSAR